MNPWDWLWKSDLAVAALGALGCSCLLRCGSEAKGRTRAVSSPLLGCSHGEKGHGGHMARLFIAWFGARVTWFRNSWYLLLVGLLICEVSVRNRSCGDTKYCSEKKRVLSWWYQLFGQRKTPKEFCVVLPIKWNCAWKSSVVGFSNSSKYIKSWGSWRKVTWQKCCAYLW